MSDVTIYGFAPSTYTRTARMAAMEKGVRYDLQPVAYGEPEHFALHPFGKMPILAHGDMRVFETLAIVSYLDNTFAGPRLVPQDVAAHIQTLTAISVAIDYAYLPIVHTKKDGDNFDPEQLAASGRVFDWLESILSARDFVSGTRFGAADIFLIPMIDYHIRQAGSDHVFASRASTEAWFTAATQRPSFKETAEAS